MLQILITEQENDDGKKYCLTFLLNNRLLDILVELALTDTPPGARVCVLNWVRRLLSCLENPPIDHASVFQPIQKLLPLCNGKIASPYETEEILFLSTVAGLVRKEPFLINLFLPLHQHLTQVSLNVKRIIKIPVKNSLFDCTKIESQIRRISIVKDELGEQSGCSGSGITQKPLNEEIDEEINCDCDENESLILLDAILSYFESADSTVVVRACEGALILASLPTINIKCNAVRSSLNSFSLQIIEKLVELCIRIPEDMDPGDIEETVISWGLFPRDSEQQHFIGRGQLCEFLCWLDYTDCLSKECKILFPFFGELFRSHLLETTIEPAMLDENASFMAILTAKIIKMIQSTFLSNEIATWLVGEGQIEEINGSDCLLTILIENAQDNSDLLLSTLQFVEALLDNPNERILHGMIFFYLNSRGYFDQSAEIVQCWSDEEDNRERRRGSADGPIKSRTLAPSNILKVINNFLLLLPRQIIGDVGGTCYEEYVQDASRHYQIWMKKTEKFDWPNEAVWSTQLEVINFKSNSNKRKESQCNDSGISEESFYEGPLLRMLFNHVRNMATQPYELNLAVIAILSKLALLPHPYLHEILLSPEIPVATGAGTLWSAMQILARFLLLEIPRIESFHSKILETGKKLLSNPPMLK